MPSEKGLNFVPCVCSAICLANFIVWSFRDLEIFKGSVQPKLIEELRLNDPHIMPTRCDSSQTRSNWEADFIRWLRLIKVDYLYEPVIFDNEYVPDFLVLDNIKRKKGVFIEVKGIWEPSAYAKVCRFNKFLGEYGLEILVVNRYIMSLIQKQLKEVGNATSSGGTTTTCGFGTF